ncbi:MAG: diaminopimelate epimerase [Ignavibacteria bacterium]
MKIKFEKFSGAGNDFIIIQKPEFYPDPDLIQRLCDRHFGIGADGVLFIDEANKADFKIRYFNSDGSGDALCVNGARCAVMFAFHKKICSNECSFEFIENIFRAVVEDKLNVKLFINYSPLIQLNKEINFLDKKILVHFVDIGSKHLIIDWLDFCSNFSSFLNENQFETFDVNYFGRLLRNHFEFQPGGVNVNFIKQVEENRIRVRTYERGVEAETLACGSGSIASSIITYLIKNIKTPINIITTSKKIFEVDFEEKEGLFSNISIKGHAEKIFEGVIEI